MLRSVVSRQALSLFGAHVIGRAQRQARLGEPTAASGSYPANPARFSRAQREHHLIVGKALAVEAHRHHVVL